MQCWSRLWQKLHESAIPAEVIIDSGAFTAFTSGIDVDWCAYGEWALEFKEKWRDKTASLHFMNLDVIGDQESSWKNQERLEKMGLHPLPIVTYGAKARHLERALGDYSYIALGGLVPHARQHKKLESWLDYCFSFVVSRYKQTGIIPKIHLLGITTEWVLLRYPAFSSDSTSFTMCVRTGEAKAAKLKKIPRYSQAPKVNHYALRCEIRKYQRLEKKATDLWRSRGIEFND